MKTKKNKKLTDEEKKLYIELEFKKNTPQWIILLESRLIDLFFVLKKCIIPICLVLIGAILFWKVDQVIDVVKSLGKRSFWFHSAVLLWALNIWYISRTFLDLSHIHFTNKERSKKIQKWVPRLLGLSVFLIIIISYSITDIKYLYTFVLFISINIISIFSFGISIITLIIPGILYFIFHPIIDFTMLSVILVNSLEVIFFCFLVEYRRITKFKFLKSNIETDNMAFVIKDRKTFNKNFLFIKIDIIILVTFFILFSISKVLIPRIFGIAGILVLALAIWTPFFILPRLLKRFKYIPIILLLLISTFLYSFINNNHEIRFINKNKLSNYFSTNNKEYIDLLKKEYNINQYFEMWIKEKKNKINSKFPIFLISVEGGGLRSAYWSGLLLSTLQDRIKNEFNLDFNEHIFSISSVSGGSLGSSIYLALVNDYLKQKKDQNFNFFDKSKNILNDDFLSPVGASLLFPEIFQRFFPLPIKQFDRSRALERSWEISWKKNIKSKKNIFDSPLLELWSFNNKKDICSVPSLFLNSTCVENGNRVILSNIFLQNNFCNCYDLKDPKTGIGIDYFNRIRLSTSVLMSARFPYITPAGRIYKNPDDFFRDYKYKIWGHVVDGGYFENSGVATTYDIYTQLNKPVKNPFDENIYFIIIKNDEKGKDKTKPSISAYEIKQPVQTLFNTWSSRSFYSIDLINKNLDNERIIQINMNIPGNEVPLGWYLSKDAENKVEGFINEIFSINKSENNRYDENKESIKKIFKILTNFMAQN